MMLVTQSRPDKSSYIVCIQNLSTNCSRDDVIDLLNSALLTSHLHQHASLSYLSLPYLALPYLTLPYLALPYLTLCW